MTRFVELSHNLKDGMDPYPGLPKPRFGAVIDHEASRERYTGGAEFYLGSIDAPANMGTYLDSPFHRFREREDLAGITLDRVADLRGFAVNARVDDRAIDIEIPAEPEGAAILIRTGWSDRWGTPDYWELGPYIAPDALERLIAAKPALVGVDCWNVDDTQDLSRRVHTGLLDAGILIVEHMTNLVELPPSGFRFYAVPLAIEGGASFPVRAFAELD